MTIRCIRIIKIEGFNSLDGLEGGIYKINEEVDFSFYITENLDNVPIHFYRAKASFEIEMGRDTRYEDFVFLSKEFKKFEDAARNGVIKKAGKGVFLVIDAKLSCDKAEYKWERAHTDYSIVYDPDLVDWVNREIGGKLLDLFSSVYLNIPQNHDLRKKYIGAAYLFEDDADDRPTYIFQYQLGSPRVSQVGRAQRETVSNISLLYHIISNRDDLNLVFQKLNNSIDKINNPEIAFLSAWVAAETFIKKCYIEYNSDGKVKSSDKITKKFCLIAKSVNNENPESDIIEFDKFHRFRNNIVHEYDTEGVSMVESLQRLLVKYLRLYLMFNASA